MTEKPLHIISFDNPYPPVYGGIVEVFHKLKPLHELGYAIYLHCFVDEIPTNTIAIDKVTKQVFYYKNSKKPLYHFSWLPYSVRSRNSCELLTNLNKILAPILFEGLKTTYLVHQNKLPDHRKILRLHNIESLYFKGISISETNLFRKIAYGVEAVKFRSYEAIFSKFDRVVTLSNFENDYVDQEFHNSEYVPVFHGNEEVIQLDGFGKYALYHGDLRASDNKRVVRQLVDIFRNIDYPLVIASGSGENLIKKYISESKNITFTPIHDFVHLKELLSNAHINLIFSFQKSGTKLKLMNALYNSRFCIINDNIMDDSRIADLCEFADNTTEIKRRVEELINKPYTDFENRKVILENEMNDLSNARLLAAIIGE